MFDADRAPAPARDWLLAGIVLLAAAASLIAPLACLGSIIIVIILARRGPKNRFPLITAVALSAISLTVIVGVGVAAMLVDTSDAGKAVLEHVG